MEPYITVSKFRLSFNTASTAKVSNYKLSPNECFRAELFSKKKDSFEDSSSKLYMKYIVRRNLYNIFIGIPGWINFILWINATLQT